MKKYIFLLLASGTTLGAFSQQLHTSSLYDLQGVLQNPSMVGVEKHAMFGATYRSQWSGIEGSPKTVTLFGSTALKNHQMGIGGYIYNDRTGPTSRSGIDIQVAKHITTKSGVFSLGIETRFQQYAIDVTKLSQSIGNDPALAGGDNKYKFDAGFGVSYSSEKFQLGASVSQLIQSKLDFYEGTATRSEEARLYRHYYAHGLYKFNVDGTTKVIPNFLLTYLPNAPVEFQGGARVEHNDVLWWGLSFRARQSWMISAGVKINKKFNLGYSFDIYRTPLSVYDAGSNGHELILRYDFFN